eukprot:Opistho-2@85746
MAPHTGEAVDVPFDVAQISGKVFGLDELECFNYIRVPIWINDVTHFRLVWGNRAACRMWKVERMSDVDLSDASPQTRAYLQGQLESWLNGATRTMPYVQRTLYPKGEAVTGQLSHAPINVRFGASDDNGRSAVGRASEPVSNLTLRPSLVRTCLVLSFTTQGTEAMHDARARECFRLCESRFWMYAIP